jgi:hypothetical protein
MKIFDKPCFDSILRIPTENLDDSVAVTVMGEKLVYPTKEKPAQLADNCQSLVEGAWRLLPDWKGKLLPDCTEAVTWVPAYSRTMGVAFLVQAKVYSATYLEALAVFIGTRLGASENTFYHIAQGQLLGRVTAEDICRAALYAVCSGYKVETYTGDNTLTHGLELLQYSMQRYEVAPQANVLDGIAEQCLNLEFEELFEKAEALDKVGYFQKLLLKKLEDTYCFGLSSDAYEGEFNPNYDGNKKVDLVALLDACVDQRVVADGTVLKFGLQQVFHQAFMLVHENNLTKFPTDEAKAKETAAFYTERGTPAEAVWNQRFADSGNWVIRRISDGKFLKPLGFEPVNLAPLFNNEKASSEAPV